MNGIRFAQGLKVLPILAPQNIVATATATSYVDLDLVNWATFAVQLGAMTSDSTDTVTFTVEASTAGTSNATEVAIAFNYRLSSAVDTDSMGAITAGSTSGVAVTAADDNKVLIVDVDPAVVQGTGADFRYVRLVATPNTEMASCNLGVVAYLEHRYPGNSIPTST